MRIVTVFNSRPLNGGPQTEFKAAHVLALQAQCATHAPFATFECFSDVDVPGVETTPLVYKWPGWWAKLELFRPDIRGGFLFVDLDTVITGDLSDILAVDKLTLLRDFYRDGRKLKEGLGGGLIYLPEEDRAPVWEYWKANPAWNMRMFGRGDQFLFEKFYLNTAQRWQDVVPGQVVSWKVHCKADVVPADARVVCFHGKPRPWEVGKFLELYR